MEPAEKKLRKGECFTRKEKQMIVNVFNHFLKKPMTVTAAAAEASEALNCSVRSIYNIRKEQQQGPLLSPKKNKQKKKDLQVNARLHTYDENVQALVRQKVHNFFLQNVAPTLNTVLAAINSDKDLCNFSRATLHRLLKDIGFEFQTVKRKSILIERDDIIRWRHKYLRDIKRFRDEGRCIVYTDESWVNVGHTVSKIWQDTTIKSNREAFVQGLSTGLKSPTGLGPRFALVHAGTENGFLSGAELTFLCKKNTADVHNEMDADAFEKWFIEQLLPNTPENAVIVLDNASYHSRKVEKIPTNAWRKENIIDWLTEKNIPVENNMLKRDLLFCVSEVKHQYDKYKLDMLAKDAGRDVLRLPPYHCELNPIEMVWAQVKNHIKRNNTTFKVKDMLPLIATAYNNVTAENWKNYIQHVQKIEDEMWIIDGLQDDIVEFIIHVEGSSPTDDSEDDLLGDPVDYANVASTSKGFSDPSC